MEEITKEILVLCEHLSDSALFDNDGGLLGYVVEVQKPEHQEMLDRKNKLLEQGQLAQFGFEVILFNYGEYFHDIALEEFIELIEDTRLINKEEDLPNY